MTDALPPCPATPGGRSLPERNAPTGHRRIGESFGSTCWTLVHRAAHGSGREAQEAWEALATKYWKPLYAFCRRKGDSPGTAEDRVQGFFASLLEKGGMAAVDPARGRFRNWLMGAIDRHRHSEWRRDRAGRRHPQYGFDRRDLRQLEEALEYFPNLEPALAFQREWAETILGQVRDSMRERYAARGLAHRFETFWSRLPPGSDSVAHQELAASLGMTPRSLATGLWQFRRQYAATLRRIVRQTLEVKSDVDEEIRELIRAVS